jgi:transcriptional regulator with XRE-family HTH domain
MKEKHMTKDASLFGDLLKDDGELQAELAKTAVAADLAVLVARSGLSRTELAQRLGWSKARVSQVLCGNGNLTVATIHVVTRALGQRFDVVFRAAHEPRAPQAWERAVKLELSGSNVFDLSAVSYLRKVAVKRRAKRLPAKPLSLLTQDLMQTTFGSEALNAA